MFILCLYIYIYPPNVGFTCLHPMIAITIDTPKWPGPEFESRSWKVFWVLKKQDFGTGSEKRRRWKIQVYVYIMYVYIYI